MRNSAALLTKKDFREFKKKYELEIVECRPKYRVNTYSFDSMKDVYECLKKHQVSLITKYDRNLRVIWRQKMLVGTWRETYSEKILSDYYGCYVREPDIVM